MSFGSRRFKEALMSKRHRKTKDMMTMFNDDYYPDYQDDFGLVKARKGKKPRGRDRRKLVAQKHAFLDE